MMTRSASWATAAPRGGRTGARTGRGGGRTRGRFGDQGNGGIDGQGGQVGGQGKGCEYKYGGQHSYKRVTTNVYLIKPPRMMTRSASWATAAPRGGRTGARTGRGGGRTRGDISNGIENDDRKSYTYKEFLAGNPKEYDGKGGVIVYTRLIEKMKSIQDTSGCRDTQKVKYDGGSFVDKELMWAGHAAYTDRIHELARLVPHLITPENKRTERYTYGLALKIRGMVAATEPATIHRAVRKAKTLTDEAIRNGSLKKNPEKRGNNEESSRDRNVRDDNKRTRTGNTFPTTTNSVRREYNGPIPKCVSLNLHHPLEIPCRACFHSAVFDIWQRTVEWPLRW
nr:hypothetical protein [Tanacetum cinerariifolium]